MRFLADMGVSMGVVRWLREQSHDAVHLREEGLQRLPNGQIFEKAVAEDRIVLTFDLDFGEIVALTHGGPVASVILFRLRDTRTPRVTDRLDRILTGAADELTRGAVVVVEDGRYRVRTLPLGS